MDQRMRRRPFPIPTPKALVTPLPVLNSPRALTPKGMSLGEGAVKREEVPLQEAGTRQSLLQGQRRGPLIKLPSIARELHLVPHRDTESTPGAQP